MSRFMEGVNLEDVPELQAIPDGVIAVEIESWEKKMSSNNNEMASICTQIIAPEELVKKVGKYYMQIPMMNSTLFKWRNLYEACGIMEKATDGFDPDDLLGKQVGIIVTLREYQGSPRNNEQKFLPLNKTSPRLTGKWTDVEAMETKADAEGSVDAGAAGVFG